MLFSLQAIQDGLEPDVPIKCSTCGVEYNTTEELLSHLKCHSRDKPYWCGYCGKVFSQEQSLKVSYDWSTSHPEIKFYITYKAMKNIPYNDHFLKVLGVFFKEI